MQFTTILTYRCYIDSVNAHIDDIDKMFLLQQASFNASNICYKYVSDLGI